MQRGIQQAMTSLQAAAKPIADAFGRLAAAAPDTVRSDFEQVAAGMNALAAGDPQGFAAAGAEVQGSMAKVTSFIAASCRGTDVSGLGSLGGTETPTTSP